MLPLVSFIAVFVLIVAFLAYSVIAAQRAAPEEGRREALYTETCGGRFRWTKYSWPFARLALYDDILVVGAAKKIVLRLQEIERVENERSVFAASFGKAVHVYHGNPAYRTPFVIYSMDREGLVRRLNEAAFRRR